MKQHKVAILEGTKSGDQSNDSLEATNVIGITIRAIETTRQPDASERKAWVHRLANLVLLNKKKNSSAQSYDFAAKCDIYFSGTKNVSSYALTSQVMAEDEWTPEIVEARQHRLLEILYEKWDIEEA